jgi:A/G-specific adenine glycosylase
MWSKTLDPYFVWVSEIMLQQTRVEAVTPKYIAFVEQFPSLESLANAEEKDLREAVAGLGYYRRFSWMVEAAKSVVEADTGFPNNYDDLLMLKGVGAYTASAIASICYDEQRAVCDGNIERIYCRVHDVQKPSNDNKVKQTAAEWASQQIPSEKPGIWNEAFMELGQVICTPTKPICGECAIENICLSKKFGTQHLAPGKKTKTAWEKVRLTAKVPLFKRNKKTQVGLITRDKTHRFLQGMTGFEIDMNENHMDTVAFKHTITHHKISGSLLIQEKKVKSGKYSWVDKELVRKALHSSFDKKIWDAALKYIF